jgi:hypothetical protein
MPAVKKKVKVCLRKIESSKRILHVVAIADFSFFWLFSLFFFSVYVFNRVSDRLQG